MVTNLYSPLVSVITPCFNSGHEIFKVINSVQNQTYNNIEHIIIDDCSSDVSSDLILELKKFSNVKYIRRKWNAGPAVTRNRGIQEANGRFIAFLDADDLWYPKKLEKQIEFMMSNEIALSYTSYDVIDLFDNIIGSRKPPRTLDYYDILKSNQIGCLTAIYDTEILGKVYMPNIAKRQDMGLWLKILKSGVNAVGLVNEPLAQYRIGAQSVSSKKTSVLKYQWRLYREVENLSFFQSMYYFSVYVYRGLTRRV